MKGGVGMVLKLKDFFLSSEFRTGRGKIFSYKFRMEQVGEYCQGDAWFANQASTFKV
jgi:hypothetical protein